nr:hypothetical protein [Tanacetum cinerariifolium]
MVLKYKQRTESDGWIWRIGKHERSKDGGVGKSIDNPYARSVENMSFSFFITNFPNTLDAKTLWTWCMMHGKVVDVYIANKLSKFGKRFARFKTPIANNMGKHVMQKSSQEKENKGSFASVVAGEGSCHNKASMGVSSKQTNTIGMKNLVLNENDLLKFDDSDVLAKVREGVMELQHDGALAQRSLNTMDLRLQHDEAST